MDEARERYVDELAIYIRWSDKKKASYRTEDVMRWGDSDYRQIHGWNDGFAMVKRVLGITKEEDDQLFEQAKLRSTQPGKDTPWNYWKETPIEQ